MLSREAAAGVQVSEGSLLENEMQFGSTSEYAAQMAAYNKDAQSAMLLYQSQLFNRRAGEFSPLTAGAMSAGTTLATNARYFTGLMGGGGYDPGDANLLN